MDSVTNTDKKTVQVVKCTDRISSPQQDSCWSWVVCFAGVVSNIIIIGFCDSYGILFPALLVEFQAGKAKTAWVGSLAMMGGVYGPMAARLYQRFGARVVAFTGALLCVISLIATSKTSNMYIMFLTYGGLYGIGQGFVSLCTYMIVPSYFKKWRSLSVCLLSMGPGGSLLVMSPIVQELFERLGWRGTFLAMAGILSICCLLLCTYQPITLDVTLDEEDCNCDQRQDGTFWDISILKNKAFVLYTTAATVFYLAQDIPHMHMVRYWEDLGFPAKQASRLYIYGGAASLFMSPVIGRIYDISWIHPPYIFPVAATVEGVAIFLLPVATTNAHFVLYFVVCGVVVGILSCGFSIAILNCLPDHMRAFGFGLHESITGIVGACGPALGGFVADVEGSYVPAFYMAGSFAVFSAITLLLAACVKTPAGLNNKRNVTDLELLVVVEKCSVV